jgi:hypothetical protein
MDVSQTWVLYHKPVDLGLFQWPTATPQQFSSSSPRWRPETHPHLSDTNSADTWPFKIKSQNVMVIYGNILY